MGLVCLFKGLLRLSTPITRFLVNMSDKSSRTSQKLRQTNETIIIAEIRSLNQRVAELLEQFGLLTMEISNVADDLENYQTNTTNIQKELDEVKDHFTEMNLTLKTTQQKIEILELKLTDFDTLERVDEER